jgi:hypothetical protein
MFRRMARTAQRTETVIDPTKMEKAANATLCILARPRGFEPVAPQIRKA